jgi:indole-3-glycerol phosphate synthase
MAGADAILLIAECLGDAEHRELRERAEALGMHALVELHQAENLPRVLDSGATLVGINNRDLRRFETRLEHTLELLEQIPDDRIVVSESGIRDRADVLRLESAGVDAILVGETLMRAPEIGQAVLDLIGIYAPQTAARP